jgi:phospholipid transport system substrate-binding protein
MKARKLQMKIRFRNSYVALWLCCCFAVAGASLSHAAVSPTDQIKATVDKALVVLKDPGLKAPAKIQERRDQLKQILFARFDFNEMAKRALGAEWRKRTPKQQEEFVSLFTELLERSYTETIEGYNNEKITYVGEKVDGTYADVNSKLFTDKGEEVLINYKVQLNGVEWRIYDVIVANISMVNNFRSQFTRVIANSSYDELIRRLKSKAEAPTQKN